MATATQLRTRPLMPGFGAEILDVDVTTADPETLREVVGIFHRTGAIVLRGQSLDKPQQVAFTTLFGPPADNIRKEYIDPDYPKVYIISNKVVNGRMIGEYNAGIGWHTDMANQPRPALCTILHAIEVPPEGSDTLIADMCAAFNALPEGRQLALDGLKVHHSFIESMKKRGLTITAEHLATQPDVFHPMVRRHASDGRRSLWVGSLVEGIVGMPNPDGAELVEELLEFATQERFIYRHKWQAGDILVWDCRCTLHTGTHFDKEKYTRLVHRTWVQGEVPL